MIHSICAIVINWNLAPMTVACVQSLLSAHLAQKGAPKSKPRAALRQIIVVDNGSADDSIAILESKLGSLVELIASPQNIGFAGGNNLAIQHALKSGADWLLLINNDTYVATDFFEQLAIAHAAHPEWSLMAPLILYDPNVPGNPENTIWSLGDRLLPGTLITRGLWRNRSVPADLPAFIDVDFLNACALLIHRTVFEKIGLFDTSYFMYAEDVDFCWRARLADFKMGCATGARMWHKVSASTGVHHPQSRYWRTSNQIRFYRRYATVWQRPLLFAFTAARTLLTMARDLVQGRTDAAQSTGRGWLDGWFHDAQRVG
ncbi:MAG: glycosyltransferase family 2 protein [Caldilineaceae bacterium]